jgi:hypothetical protein
MPMAADAAGVPFEELAERLLATANSRSSYPLNAT